MIAQRILIDQSEIESVPDGTIITWLRIPGDSTSAAVAFVNHESEQNVDLDGRPTGPDNGMHRITWISPGGWQPMTVEDAGVTYPAQVLRWGENDHTTDAEIIRTASADWGRYESPRTLPEFQRITVLPDPPEFVPLLHGGTWAREKALECASRVHARLSWTTSNVLATAEDFEAWLNRNADLDASVNQ